MHLQNEKLYSPIFELKAKSKLLNAIWSDIYKEDYPTRAEVFGFVSQYELNRIEEELQIDKGEVLLDVGCGRGGVGLCVAERRNIKLIGIDILEQAIEQAKTLKNNFNLEYDAQFFMKSCCSTGLEDASINAIMSIDVLWMVNDKEQAIREMARVIRPSSRFIFTTWVVSIEHLEFLLKINHFKIIYSEEPPYWRERQLKIYESIIRYKDELQKEIGDMATRILVSEAENASNSLKILKRLLVVSEKI